MCVVVVVLLLLHAWRIGRSRNNTNSHASSFFDARLFRVEAARTSTRRCFPSHCGRTTFVGEMSRLSAVLAALLVLPNLAPAFQPPAGQLHHRPLVSRTFPSGGRRSQRWVAATNTAERHDTLPRIETGGGSAAPAASSANLTELSRVAPSSMTVKDAALEASTLAESYKRSGEITKIFSKTFYFGTRSVASHRVASLACATSRSAKRASDKKTSLFVHRPVVLPPPASTCGPARVASAVHSRVVNPLW